MVGCKLTKRKRLVIIFSVIAALTALIIINSAVFSIRIVNANALNYPNNAPEIEKLNEIISEYHGVRLGSSIFMLNEYRARESIQRNLVETHDLAHIEIRSIERLFPNRLMIHYIVLRPYIYKIYNGYAFVFWD